MLYAYKRSKMCENLFKLPYWQILVSAAEANLIYNFGFVPCKLNFYDPHLINTLEKSAYETTL